MPRQKVECFGIRSAFDGPGSSGPELAQKIAVRRPETLVLFMSGYTDDAIVHHGVLDAGVAFLERPFRPDELLGKARKALGTSQ